jgi:hypothetical protein
MNRYGVRAFSTLEGYAGRNRETELAFLRFGNARSPSRFSSEMGTKADAKQQLEGFCALLREFAVERPGGPEVSARDRMNGKVWEAAGFRA